MKKLLAFAICTMLLFSCLTVASADKISATPSVRSGSGVNNTYFATISLSAKDGYYSSVAGTLYGTYRFYESSQTYVTSDSVSGTSAYVNQDVSVTARVYPSRVEDTQITYSVQGLSAYYRN